MECTQHSRHTCRSTENETNQSARQQKVVFKSEKVNNIPNFTSFDLNPNLHLFRFPMRLRPWWHKIITLCARVGCVNNTGTTNIVIRSYREIITALYKVNHEAVVLTLINNLTSISEAMQQNHRPPNYFQTLTSVTSAPSRTIIFNCEETTISIQ